MRTIMRQYKLFALLVACFCFAGAASAELMVLQPGDPLGNEFFLGGPADGTGLSESAVAVSWLQFVDYQNVIIDVYNLENDSQADLNVDFFLTNDLAGANIFQSSVTVAPGLGDGQPFNGITLGAGTWFLIASAPGLAADWLYGNPGGTNGPQASLGSEFVRNAADGFVEFAGDDALGFGFQAQGDVGASGIPEPGTWLLMGTGLLGLAGVLRRRRS